MDRLATAVTRRRRGCLLATALTATLIVAGCGDNSPSDTPGTSGPSPAASAAAPATPAAPTAQSSTVAAAASPPAALIPQPSVVGLAVQTDATRVDLVMPTFSNPTAVSNPLFPISQQESVLLLGIVDGEPFRTEVTLLPDPRLIEWNGQVVPTLVSQYVAFLSGRLHEVAYDFYAQADDGSVWYFGEDVFNFADGAIVDTHGTWIAGKDGPAAMIMPGDPQVGDVYRPENIPGFVFEEVTVKSIDQTLDGPLGPVAGGLVIEEVHMDGSTEDKSFGPGYGEFYTGGGGDIEALALARTTDALSGSPPADLLAIETATASVLDATRTKDWSRARSAQAEIVDAWDRTRAQAGLVPTSVDAVVGDAMGALTSAIKGRDQAAAGLAAIDVARSALDLELRYRPAVQIDVARFRLWLEQLQVDATARDADGMNGDFFALDYVRDRIAHALDDADVATMNLQLEELLGAIGDRDYEATIKVARQLLTTLDSVVPTT